METKTSYLLTWDSWGDLSFKRAPCELSKSDRFLLIHNSNSSELWQKAKDLLAFLRGLSKTKGEEMRVTF